MVEPKYFSSTTTWRNSPGFLSYTRERSSLYSQVGLCFKLVFVFCDKASSAVLKLLYFFAVVCYPHLLIGHFYSLVPLFQNECFFIIIHMKMILFCMKMNLWFRTKTRFDTEVKSDLEAVYCRRVHLYFNIKPLFSFSTRKVKVKLILNVRFETTCAKL